MIPCNLHIPNSATSPTIFLFFFPFFVKDQSQDHVVHFYVSIFFNLVHFRGLHYLSWPILFFFFKVCKAFCLDDFPSIQFYWKFPHIQNQFVTFGEQYHKMMLWLIEYHLMRTGQLHIPQWSSIFGQLAKLQNCL